MNSFYLPNLKKLLMEFQFFVPPYLKIAHHLSQAKQHFQDPLYKCTLFSCKICLNTLLKLQATLELHNQEILHALACVLQYSIAYHFSGAILHSKNFIPYFLATSSHTTMKILLKLLLW